MTDLREKAREMAVRTGVNTAAFSYEFHRDGYAREAMAIALEWAAEQLEGRRFRDAIDLRAEAKRLREPDAR
jgi:hypothetical protein